MTTLHTVNKFGLTSSALDSCLRVALPGDAILLLEDGVYNVVGAPRSRSTGGFVRDDDHADAAQSRARPAPTEGSSGVRVYALKEDLQARGIAHDSLPSSIEPITYAEFVALVCEHKKSVSWF